MKKETVCLIILAKAMPAFLIALAWNSSLCADGPVFEAPAGNQMGVWKDVGTAGFSAGVVDRPSLALDGNDVPYVAYRDQGNSRKATVMKFDGGSWVVVGSAGFSAGEARYVSIAFDSSNTPHVVYEDYANANKATVMKFDGNAWVTVGTAGFSPDGASNTSIAFANGITPYVLYEYSGPLDEDRIAVMRFNGIGWVTVGSANFTPGDAYDSSLAIDGNGVPYVSFVDIANDDKVTVMKFNGGSWVAVGIVGFSVDYVGEYTDIAIAPSGAPYVVYEEGDDRNATVMTFNGTSWVVVGVAGFTAGEAHTPSLAIDSNGNPYVAYGDYAESEKLTVMKFDGSSWSVVDIAGVTAGYVFNPSISIDSANQPFVAYEDWGNEGKASVVKTIDGFQYQIAENATAVGTIAAVDPEDDPVTYNMSEGDSTHFYLDGVNGELSFALAPDFEVPADTDGNNIYEFTVTAIAGEDETSTKVRVTVGNEEEPPTLLVQPVWETVGMAGFSSGISSSPNLAVDGNNTPYMIYRSMSGGVAAVQRYDGENWEFVGSGVSAGYATETSMAFDSNNTPYAVFRDEANSNKVTVKKYDGVSWVSVGMEGFTAVSPNYTYIYPAIAIDGNDVPYVVYSDAANLKKATAMKFNGSSWVTVGSAGFSADRAMYISMAIDSGGTPFVAFRDVGNSNKATVMKFDGDSWGTVGSAGFSPDWVNYNTSIAIDTKGVPYVAFDDRVSLSYRSTVMRYNGSSWITVGPRGFSLTDTGYTSLALDWDDVPYVAYAGRTPGGVTVMKYHGDSWGVVGTPNFSDGAAQNTTIAFGSIGTPYVGFWDYENGSRATVMKTVSGVMRHELFENTTVVGGISALDPENDPIAYSISGGDSGHFSIDEMTGVVRFLVAPDFENPQDADLNNIYEFTVQISAGGVGSTGQVVVAVLDDTENIIAVAPIILGDQFEFTVNGSSGMVIVIEACVDLANPTWVELDRITLTDGMATFTDADLPTSGNRFYRAWIQ